MSQTLETNFQNPSTPLEEEIAALGPWFHNLHLPDSSQTAPHHPLGDFPSFKWKEIAGFFPADLTGKRVLDIGCNAGFYTFELAKRGALASGIDVDEHYLHQAGWAAKQFGLEHKVQFRRMQVYDLAPEAEQYDYALFMGVFYHLRHPLLALDIVARLFKEFMVFQTMTMPGLEELDCAPDLKIDERDAMLQPGWPKMAFIEQMLEGDPTNWWAPNHAAVEAMLRSSGLTVTARPAHEIYVCSRNDQPVIRGEELAALRGLKVLPSRK